YSGCLRTDCSPHHWRNSGKGEQQVCDMAKEGADMTEETEYMIDRNAGKEGVSVESPSNAKEMRAVVLAGFGGLNKLRVTKKAMPEPQNGEVKIRIGDRVMAFMNYNAWAEVVCTPVDFVYKMPDEMMFAEAAAFSLNFVAAYMMLFEVAKLREGMSVLVHSAGGAVGCTRMQMLPVALFVLELQWSPWQLPAALREQRHCVGLGGGLLVEQLNQLWLGSDKYYYVHAVCSIAIRAEQTFGVAVQRPQVIPHFLILL
ncbi:hypothetical protein GOODEAATRI_020098, partial [Goodea atripinnis]